MLIEDIEDIITAYLKDRGLMVHVGRVQRSSMSKFKGEQPSYYLVVNNNLSRFATIYLFDSKLEIWPNADCASQAVEYADPQLFAALDIL